VVAGPAGLVYVDAVLFSHADKSTMVRRMTCMKLASNQIIVRSKTVDVPKFGENIGTSDNPIMAEDGPFGLAGIVEYPDLEIDPRRFTGVQHFVFPTEFKDQYTVVQILSVFTEEQLADFDQHMAEHMANNLEALGDDAEGL